MQAMLDMFLLILGLILLVQSAKIFVNASVDIATRLKIPRMIIGLTIVAMGTSAPEVVISVSAAIGGSSDLAIANVVGSNLFNLLFIVGFCAMLFPITVRMKAISRDYWVSAAATIMLLVMVLIFNYNIPRLGGLSFLILFAIYMVVLVRHTVKNKATEPETEQTDASAKPKAIWHSIIFAIIGISIIIAAGQLTVSSAVNIALAIGISERVVGLTIVAMGTALPEFVTTIIACKKGEGEFALGFIIGSSIFNIMFVLGLAGTITPLALSHGVLFDTTVLLAGTLAFFLFAKSGEKLIRLEGFCMVAIFGAYMTWVLLA